jgi:formylglycine-generating enzyme required for sulfatase activity
MSRPPRRGSVLRRLVDALAVVLLIANGCGQPRRGRERGAAGPVEVEVSPAALLVTEVRTQTGDTMLLLPGGSFAMGSTTGAAAERPVHQVRLSPFLMDRCEVTQEQFARAELPDPSHFKNPRHPVDQANWTDAARFCNERSRAEGLQPCYDETTWSCDLAGPGYRLPTEAEWEYACRAGTSTRYSCGDEARALPVFAWFAGNAAGTTHPVGQKRPNAWGLYDLHGNVAEWCQDGFDPSYYQNSPSDNPPGPENAGPERVVRGGSWKSSADACRAAARAGDRSVLDTCTASDALGFRCVRRAPAALP